MVLLYKGQLPSVQRKNPAELSLVQCSFWWEYRKSLHDPGLHPCVLHLTHHHSNYSLHKNCSLIFTEEKKSCVEKRFHYNLIWRYWEVPQVRKTVKWTTINIYHSRMYTHGRKVVIRMLLVVVCAFFICWAPFHAQRLLFMLVTLKNAWNKQLMYVQYVLYILSGWYIKSDQYIK